MREDVLQKIISENVSKTLKLLFFETLDSTNTYLATHLDLLSGGSPVLVVANEQVNGRGREQSKWVSDRDKSLTFSLGIQINKQDFTQSLPIQVAVALAETLNRYSRQARIKIKWPNDLYTENAGVLGKCAGILVDCYPSKGHYKVVIGVGLNLKPLVLFDNDRAPDYAIAYYDSLLDKPMLLSALVESLLNMQLSHCLDQTLLHAYQKLDYLYHKKVDVFRYKSDEEPLYKGLCQGVHEDGMLMVLTADNTLKLVHAGHVKVISDML